MTSIAALPRDTIGAARARKRVGVGDVTEVEIAAHMGLTALDFRDALPSLLARGFPAPDPTTGRFDLQAVDLWRAARYPHLYRQDLTGAPGDTIGFADRLARFRKCRDGARR